MKVFISTTFVVIFCFFFGILSAQDKNSVSGKITSSDGSPLFGASVLLKGTKRGVITDKFGFFKISNLKAGEHTLRISMVGYKAVELPVSAGQKALSVMLETQEKKLKEVSVTALAEQRKELPSVSLRLKSPIKALPQQVQVINSELLESQQITDMLEGAIRNVSGANPIEHWGYFARINMRGFRLPAFRNGVNISDKWGPLSEDMFMVDRIEFVKGPSGFMMSAGEPGGFYNVVSKKPRNRKIAKLSGVVGTQEFYRVAADFGGKLGIDQLSYRLNAMYQSKSSHRKFEKSSRFGIAPAIAYRLTKKTTLLAEFSYQKAESHIGAAYIFAPVSKGYGSLDRNFTMIDSNFPKTQIGEISFSGSVTHDFNTNWSLQAQYVLMNYTQEGASTWTYAVNKNGDATRSVSIWDALSKGDYFQIYLLGEFKTAALQHNILAGFDFTDKNYWADFGQSGMIDSPKKPFNIYNPTYGDRKIPTFDRSISLKSRKKAYHYASLINSFYVQDQLGFLENKIRLTLAARYTQLLDLPYNKSVRDKYDKITPRFGISADVMPQITLYALYDQSFLPPSGIPRPGEKKFKPIEGNIYEGGLKSDFLDKKLKTSLSAYVITKNNVSVADARNTGKERYSVQLGEVQSKGFEIDFLGKPVKGLTLRLNYANTTVEITKDPKPENVGKRVPGHAKHITNGWVDYQFGKDTPVKGLGLAMGYQYQIERSSWAWGAANKTDLPSYFRLDAAVSWTNKKIRLALNVNNILDEYLYSGSNYGTYLYWQSEAGINGRLSVSYSLY